MLLKSLRLRNIRSYESQEINFSTGSTLLAGDIGVGKSSILLAIEFALFGTRRKHLSASSLLRHGKKEGDVELKFSLDGKEIVVKRKLKRGKDDIKQEAGYIITNGLKKEGTHIELKTDILKLLGYPQDLVSKSRDLVYRYTVYTPQEQMKQIILEDKDIRLDTLRKVFNIDKYKRIKENSQIYTRALKEKRKNYEGQIVDLEEKKKLKKERESEVGEFSSKLDELLPKVELLKTEVKEKKELIDKKEKDVNKFNRLSKELEIEELKLNNNLENRVAQEVEKNRIQDQHMLQQSRLAQMGEMVSMIAHQWRQPLNALSASAISLSLLSSMDKLDTKK
ncbi:MAG: SMC family ATPase, partial [Nanoarchaeota archaeon]|nr:SMC family ATPase [Nanoarchaeota archaeon]